jgi:hypothetical protein
MAVVLHQREFVAGALSRRSAATPTFTPARPSDRAQVSD